MGAELLLLALVAATCLQVDSIPPETQQQSDLVDCPSRCVCGPWLRLPKATCTGQRLYSIYAGVSSVVQALDLSNNTISSLRDRELSRAGLTRLRYLNLSMNAINEIDLRAFQDLKNLTVLDLSFNHVDFIPTNTFYDNQNLRIVHLAGNKFNLHVPNLNSTSIEELNLSRCRINYLPKDTFAGLKKLRKLDLSNNMLADLNKEVLYTMPLLGELLLERNLWSCGSVMYNLKMYMRSHNIETKPICEKPTLTSKFENIIALKTVSTESEILKSTKKLSELKKIPEINKNSPESRINKESWDVDSWRELEEAIHEEEEQSDDAGSPGIFGNALNNVSPFWFLLIGFLLGSGATMIITYLWFSSAISSFIPSIGRDDAGDSVDASSQRVSLLRHLWQQENIANSEESSGSTTGDNRTSGNLPASAMTPSCPGTPPPPYREVMLHRNLYPRAAMVAAAQQPTNVRLLNDTSASNVYII